MRIAFTTLGCKINQFETDVLRQNFESRGDIIVPFNTEADVYVINTCSVTAKSDYQCRQAIRSAVRRGRGATVVVTGCYAELQPDEIKKIPGVDFVLGNQDKTTIPDRIAARLSSSSIRDRGGANNDSIQTTSSRTRGFLKIQDGCDSRCSYCIVPLARGGSRSVSAQDVVREFTNLIQVGYPEIVLTGIHIGKYGLDLNTGMNLAQLLKMLISERGVTRIRLSSIEPAEINRELIAFLGKGLCRHLHIPLQSGDDAILASMGRNYTSGFYQKLIEVIAAQVPGIALGADIMVGFPGEGELEFQNTMRLVEQSPLTHLHVFSYSSRPGTSAADMNGQVPEGIKKARSEALRTLGREKNFDFRKKQMGHELEVVVEDKKDAHTGILTGLTDNYIRLHISGAEKGHIGKKIMARINVVKEQANFAEII